MKLRSVSTRLHGATSQKTATFTTPLEFYQPVLQRVQLSSLVLFPTRMYDSHKSEIWWWNDEQLRWYVKLRPVVSLHLAKLSVALVPILLSGYLLTHKNWCQPSTLLQYAPHDRRSEISDVTLLWTVQLLASRAILIDRTQVLMQATYTSRNPQTVSDSKLVPQVHHSRLIPYKC
jgi:hypothetical protein